MNPGEANHGSVKSTMADEQRRPSIGGVSVELVLERYFAVNGHHPMTAADDAYVRKHFVEVPDSPDLPQAQVLALMTQGRLPLPSYVLSDGTPMVHPDYLEPLRKAGSVDALHEWFVAQWPDSERDVAEEEWTEGYLSGQYVCLWSVTPETIQAKAEAIEAIKAELAALAAGTGSKEWLGMAVDRLDALEPPFAPYDELRFAGPTSRQVWIDDVRASHLD